MPKCPSAESPTGSFFQNYMEPLKHECGVALIRLRKPVEYYREKYGSASWGLAKLYLLMEKQHNRGQEAAGVGVVKLKAEPGHEYVYRERAIGAGAIDEIFGNINRQLASATEGLASAEDIAQASFIGDIYMECLWLVYWGIIFLIFILLIIVGGISLFFMFSNLSKRFFSFSTLLSLIFLNKFGSSR